MCVEYRNKGQNPSPSHVSNKGGDSGESQNGGKPSLTRLSSEGGWQGFGAGCS